MPKDNIYDLSKFAKLSVNTPDVVIVKEIHDESNNSLPEYQKLRDTIDKLQESLDLLRESHENLKLKVESNTIEQQNMHNEHIRMVQALRKIHDKMNNWK
jgi:hypothetical protein